MKLRYGRGASPEDRQFIDISEIPIVSWQTIDANLEKVCSDPSNFIQPEEGGIFDNSSNVRKAFNAAISLISGKTPYSFKRNEIKFFESYVKWLTSNKSDENVVESPALVPETIIEIPHEHFDKDSALPRQKTYMVVDFFWRDRGVSELDIVVEIDGNSHYEPVEKGEKLMDHSVKSDDERMRVFTNHTIRDRALVLGGYKVFRFSISELNRHDLDGFLHPFFDRVFNPE